MWYIFQCKEIANSKQGFFCLPRRIMFFSPFLSLDIFRYLLSYTTSAICLLLPTFQRPVAPSPTLACPVSWASPWACPFFPSCYASCSDCSLLVTGPGPEGTIAKTALSLNNKTILLRSKRLKDNPSKVGQQELADKVDHRAKTKGL